MGNCMRSERKIKGGNRIKMVLSTTLLIVCLAFSCSNTLISLPPFFSLYKTFDLAVSRIKFHILPLYHFFFCHTVP